MKAIQPGPWTQWPWHRLGNFKYLMYAPIVASVGYEAVKGFPDSNRMHLHMLILAALRHFVGQLGISLSRWSFLTRRHEIQRKGVSFDAIDHSSNWDDYIILDALAVAVAYMTPAIGGQRYPVWDGVGLVICLLLHAGPTEAIYYWLHRALHNHYLYTRYHSHHHSLFITEANSGTVHPFLEHVMYALNFSIPVLGTLMLGRLSISLFYVYFLGFDIMNAIGHCNFEFVPECLFRAFPPLKYLVYTPSYHSLHHSQVHTNFCLFMPMYDYWGGTMDTNTDTLFQSVRRGRKDTPDVVYLTHGMDLLQMLHATLGIQSFAASPYTPHWLLYPLYPLALLAMPLLWLFGQPFATDKYRIPGDTPTTGETWLIPRYRFHYALQSEKRRINGLIESAVQAAEGEGCRVLSLGMMNKDMGLNSGGETLIQQNPNLRIRIVSGLTLTAAVVVHRLPKNVTEVFLVGSGEVSRAVATCLAGRGVRVVMLTASRRRFEGIQSEVAEASRRFLVNVTKFQAGQRCKEWLLEGSEGIRGEDQAWAPAGAVFHRLDLGGKAFLETRRDCTYGTSPALRVPRGIKGLRSCEGDLPREVVHACHAAGLVHSLENWKHHEVGPVRVERIDAVWEAALKHGFQLAA